MNDLVREAAIRALFAQMRNTLPAVLVIVTYMIGATLPFNGWQTVAAWVASVLLFQWLRELLRRRFEKDFPEGPELEWWARAFVVHQALAGAVWASSMFLFAHPDQPITVALTLCCLFSVAAGAVPAQAYTPASFYALVSVLFTMAPLRLIATGEFSYILLGIASALFGAAMAGYCRIHSAIVRDSLRIRFENEALVEELRLQKAEAESAQRRAELANVAKSQFLAAASHDLRQPLYALSLFSASLDTLKLDEAGKSVVAQIHSNISAMEQLFNKLLDLSRLEAGVVKPRVAAISVDEMFDRLSQIFWPIAYEAGLDLRFRSDGEWIRSDVALVEQILSNLLSNALRATSRGGVLVAARKRRNTVRLEVWDTGRGIPPDDRDRVFEEFVQIGNAERDRRKGLGLGLAIVRRAVELVGSQIELRSRPGSGSCFSFWQPLTLPESQEVPASGPIQTEPAGASTVLVVEDDVDVRAALADLLQRWEVHADVAANANEALEMVSAGNRYDLVLTDYRLPGELNGIQLIDAISNSHPMPSPRAILITGDMTSSLIVSAQERNIPLLHKPLSSSQLRQLLEANPS